MTPTDLINHVVSIRADRRNSIVTKAISVRKKSEPKTKAVKTAVGKLSQAQIQSLLASIQEA